MTVGTRSLLFGVHQALLHPALVWLAWVRLRGLGRVRCRATGLRVSALDPRLWLCLLVHDWGYWGSPDMDGERGKWHPLLGARLVSALVPGDALETPDPRRLKLVAGTDLGCWNGVTHTERICACAAVARLGPWGFLVLLHSRSLAHRLDLPPSALAAADKLAISSYPAWLYLPLARWSGELAEYMRLGSTPEARERGIDASTPERWLETVSAYTEGVARQMAAGGEGGTPPEDGGRP